jgi:hypothetical protein
MRGAEDLSAVSTVMLPAVERMEFFITFEAVDGLIVAYPLLLGTEGSLYYLLHLFVHQSTIITYRITHPLTYPCGVKATPPKDSTLLKTQHYYRIEVII